MTRLERKRRRQWIAVWLILSAAIITLAAVVVYAEPWSENEVEVERVVYDPPAKPIAEIKAEIAMRSDHPNRFYYRQEIPLGRYQQETLYNAAVEWGIPYELALAVCFRETNFRNMETEVDGKHYYGMMAVQRESADYYMDLCNVEYLNSEQDRVRVGCCILSEHIKNEGSVYKALCRYSNDYEGWYAESVLSYMEGLLE